MQIRPPVAADEKQWRDLWQQYLVFYKSNVSSDVTRHTWNELINDSGSIHGFVAEDNTGQLLGLVHYLFHPVTWAIAPRCYLEGLFTTPEARGKGVGRTLIEAVTKAARLKGSDQVYWLTERDNVQAQALYDKIATKTGFIKYQKPL